MQPITAKQQEILLLLYRYRFLDRSHIQRFLNHKDARRIKSWLKDLTDKHIIGRHYSPRLGENIKPAVYYLTTKSKKLLEGQPTINKKLLSRIYREHQRSKRFIDHSLLLADIYFYLQARSEHDGSKLHFYTETDLSTHYYLPYNRPDAYIALEDNDTSMKRYFLEIIDEGTPRFMMRKRVEQYLDYFQSDKWHDKTGHDFPSILIVCSDEKIKHYMTRFIDKILETEILEEINFYVSVNDAIPK